MPLFAFRKDEILRKKKLIDRLFTEGSSFYVYPVKIYWLLVPQEADIPAQVLFNVSKRAYPHATDRNRIRRQLRGAFRLQKNKLYEHLAGKQQQCIMALIYTSAVRIPSADLEIKIKTILKRLFQEIDRRNLKIPDPLPTD